MESNGENIKAKLWWRRISYVILLLLLVLVWFCGFPIIWYSKTAFVYLFGISGFSIAYAIHFFSISIAINGALLRGGHADNTITRIYEVERDIVGRGLWVLGGGLGILLSGGILLVAKSEIPYASLKVLVMKLAQIVYLVAGLSLVINVGLYYFSYPREYRYERQRRHWAREILKILRFEKSCDQP